MNENAKCYSMTCAKIGLAMLLFYAFFTLSTFAIAILEGIFTHYEKTFRAEATFDVLYAIAYFLSFAIPAFILIRMCKTLPSSRPIYKTFKFSRWILAIIIVVVAINFTISYLNNLVVTAFLPKSSSSLLGSGANLDGRPMSEIWVLFFIEILSTAIVPAFCEEYLFRGAVLTNLLPFGKSSAIFASALLFGLMHQNPLQMLYTVLMGVIIGCVYVKTKSIWACIILHGLNNLVTVLEDFLPVFTGKDWVPVLLDLVVLVLGGVCLVLIMVHQSKEALPQDVGSFGKVYDRGMEYEELPLDLPAGKKLKAFFAPTVIIFAVICLINIGKTLLSYHGISLV